MKLVESSLKGFNTVTVFGRAWAEFDKSAAGFRTISLLEIFQKKGLKMRFVSNARLNESSARLERMGIETVSISPNDEKMELISSNLSQEDLVIFDTFVTVPLLCLLVVSS